MHNLINFLYRLTYMQSSSFFKLCGHIVKKYFILMICFLRNCLRQLICGNIFTFQFFKLSREEPFKSTKIWLCDTQMHVKHIEHYSNNMKNKILRTWDLLLFAGVIWPCPFFTYFYSTSFTLLLLWITETN